MSDNPPAIHSPCSPRPVSPSSPRPVSIPSPASTQRLPSPSNSPSPPRRLRASPSTGRAPLAGRDVVKPPLPLVPSPPPYRPSLPPPSLRPTTTSSMKGRLPVVPILKSRPTSLDYRSPTTKTSYSSNLRQGSESVRSASPSVTVPYSYFGQPTPPTSVPSQFPPSISHQPTLPTQQDPTPPSRNYSFHQLPTPNSISHQPTPAANSYRHALPTTQNYSPFNLNRNYSLHQQPTPPSSLHRQPSPPSSLYQQPTPATSLSQQPTPPNLNYSYHQQSTSPYPNYSFHQLPTPPTSLYQQSTPYQKHSVDNKPAPPGQVVTVPGSGHSSYPLYQGQGVFNGAPDLFIDSSNSNKFMETLLQHTIIGAEFDSSDRHPPPRCHPGTRLAIIERCRAFIANEDKLCWVVGAAGIGKSAVMQTVAEEASTDVTLGASVFFSVNGRQDGTKTFTTIAYQLAAKYEPYYQFIRNEINRDPSLLRKSLSVHFKRFIVEPFIHQHLFYPSDRFLIIIDGLDQCDDPFMQRDLLGLISYFCISYPMSPIRWIISSRPESHITSFFDEYKFAPSYTKEEITVDSEAACEDVERYLRAGLGSIQFAYPSLRRRREWPSEAEFIRIANAAGGLFAFASAVLRYIGDPRYKGPGSRISKVLAVTDTAPDEDLLGTDQPLAQLDALYNRIISHIPDDVFVDTKKLLLLRLGSDDPFRVQCNLLGLSEDTAYTATGHIHSVASVPRPNEADNEPLKFFHKSFEGYLCNFSRSGFSHNIKDDIQQLLAQCSLRIVQQVSNDFDDMPTGEVLKYSNLGYLKGGPGICNTIPLSWPDDGYFELTDDELRLKLYTTAIEAISFGFKTGVEAFVNMSCLRILTTRFTLLGIGFPFYQVRDFVFNKFRRELTECDLLKQVPLRTLDFAAICGPVHIQFTRLMGAEPSDPWNPSCTHEKKEVSRGWSTSFGRYEDDSWSEDDNVSSSKDIGSDTEIPRFNLTEGNEFHWCFLGEECLWEPERCDHCLKRLARYFMNNPNQLVTVFVDSTQLSYAELSFVDLDDGVSQWRYRFFHSGSPTM